MNMLELVQNFCQRTGDLAIPTTVYGSSDPQLLQIMAILEEEGNDLAGRLAWQALTFEASHTTLAAEDQGAITSIATNGFRYIKNETIWDRTDKLPVLGPLNDKEWQDLKARATTGPRYQYRIRGGKLLVNPTPTAGHSWYFEYVSKNWILGADGTTYKQYFTLDTDNFLLPEEILLMGLRWRWLKEKGMEYAEIFRTYEMQVKDAMGRDGGKRRLSMDGSTWNGPRPGVMVPDMSWNVP